MSQDTFNKKLFQVAKEFNVATITIVEALGKAGFTVKNSFNEKVSLEMYSAVEKAFGVDKARNKEHERVRGEYEDLRTAIQTGRNEVISVGSDLPIAPIDTHDLVPLAPIEPDLKPLPKPQPKPEPVIEPIIEPVVVVKPEPKPKPVVEIKPEPVIEVKTPVAEPEVVEDVENEPEMLVDAEVIRGRAEKLRGATVLGRITITAAPTADADGAEARKKKKKKKLIAAGRKPGDPAPAGDSNPATTITPKPKTAGTTAASDDSRNKKKKKGTTGRTGVDEKDVDKKMKETLAALQGGANKSRKKNRKKRREDFESDRAEAQEYARSQEGIIEVTEFITVSDLADLLEVSPTKIITSCMSIGLFVSINQRLDRSTIELIGSEYDAELLFVDAEELSEDLIEEVDSEESLLPRAPVVTVMGHVDHGKTSLLDYIRKTRVTAGEAGGITQHIGAYAVVLGDGRKITFLDTPGHEAFTAMRARGAQATDIVILVIAADDMVMPQTVEAINHAQAAGVPIVVAMNKIDKAGANTDRIRQQLSDHNVLVEEWGGKAQAAEVSAHTGVGIDTLLEKVLIEAELMDLRANPERRANGIVLETKIDKGKGVVANILVQRGTLRVGDPFVAGPFFGRVRSMENEKGARITEAGPSTPIQMTGFDGIPQAGDRMMVTADEKTAKEIASQRQQLKREQDMRRVKHITLDEISRRLREGETAELNLILKGDVDGSIEALSGSLQKLGTKEAKVNIIHTGVGAISESDVLLASASSAIIIGFQVRPTANARKLAERESIDIRLYSVIYDALDNIRDALEGMLSPELGEKILGSAEVRNTFKVPNVGTIAGCYVTEGKLARSNKIRLIRDSVVIFDGSMSSLKRFKDDVREVLTGYECGIGINNYNDLKEGDVIESYEITETKRKLS
jgi:translation initiation factor IF-2